MLESRRWFVGVGAAFVCLAAVVGPTRTEAKAKECKGRGQSVTWTEQCCRWLEKKGPVGQRTCRPCGGRSEEPCGLAKCKPPLTVKGGRCVAPSTCGGDGQRPCDGLAGCDAGFTKWLRDGKCHPVGERFAEAREKIVDAIEPGEINNAWRKEQCRAPRRGVKSTRWVEGRYRVPNGPAWGRGKVCEWTTDDGRTLFEDGCSGQAPGGVDGVPWGRRFHEACVLHDMCYHHNPSAYGKDQKYCDEQMLDGMKAICRSLFGDQKRAADLARCSAAATTMFLALRAQGGPHFATFDIKTPYLDLFPPVSRAAR